MRHKILEEPHLEMITAALKTVATHPEQLVNDEDVSQWMDSLGYDYSNAWGLMKPHAKASKS